MFEQQYCIKLLIPILLGNQLGRGNQGQEHAALKVEKLYKKSNTQSPNVRHIHLKETLSGVYFAYIVNIACMFDFPTFLENCFSRARIYLLFGNLRTEKYLLPHVQAYFKKWLRVSKFLIPLGSLCSSI